MQRPSTHPWQVSSMMTMKLQAALLAAFTLFLSTVSASRYKAYVRFLPAPRVFPPWYVVNIDVREHGQSFHVILRTQEPAPWLAGYGDSSSGFIEIDDFSAFEGQYGAVINDNVDDNGAKALRIEWQRDGQTIKYVGDSVTEVDILDLGADSTVHPLDDYTPNARNKVMRPCHPRHRVTDKWYSHYWLNPKSRAVWRTCTK